MWRQEENWKKILDVMPMFRLILLKVIPANAYYCVVAARLSNAEPTPLLSHLHVFANEIKATVKMGGFRRVFMLCAVRRRPGFNAELDLRGNKDPRWSPPPPLPTPPVPPQTGCNPPNHNGTTVLTFD